VGFEAGEEKKYAEVIAQVLGAQDGCAAPPAAPAPGGPASRPKVGAVRVPWWPDKPKPQRILFHTESSTDAPHRGVLPLRFAVAAKEKGHDAVVFLAGDATLLMKDEVAASTKAAGQPDAASLIRRCAELDVPIFL
jgi:DsrE/DsrF-like family